MGTARQYYKKCTQGVLQLKVHQVSVAIKSTARECHNLSTLFTHRYTDGQQVPPSPGLKMTAREFHRQKKFHKACSNILIELNSINRI